MVRSGIKTASQIIEQVCNNDAGLTSLDLTKNATFCMKAVPNMQALSAGLSKNTVIKTLVLRECEITDPGAEALGKALVENHTIEEIDLEKNRITTHGVVAIAEGLAKNRGVRTLNLLGQSQAVLGEQCVESFIAMFNTNITLTKLMWKVNSRNTWELSKKITRNVEILRNITAGADYEHLLPPGLKSSDAPAVPSTAKEPTPEAQPVAAKAVAAAPEPVAPAVAAAPEPVAPAVAAAPEPEAESAEAAPAPAVAAAPEPEAQAGEAEAKDEKDEKAQAEDESPQAVTEEVATDMTTSVGEKKGEGEEDGAVAATEDGNKAVACEAEDTEDADASIAVVAAPNGG